MIEFNREDYVKYRLQRAKETISEIDILIQNRYWNTAVNRMYYACFYAVGALLFKNGIDVSGHSSCRQQFGQKFVHPGKISKELGKHFTELFEKRIKGDYNDFFDFDEETVRRLYAPSILFIKKVEELINE